MYHPTSIIGLTSSLGTSREVSGLKFLTQINVLSTRTGEEAVKAKNVFYYLTYTGAVDLESIQDPQLRKVPGAAAAGVCGRFSSPFVFSSLPMYRVLRIRFAILDRHQYSC